MCDQPVLYKHLSYFNYISVTKRCYQIGFPLRSFLLSPFSENLFGYIPGISTTTMHATKELLQGQMSKIKETELKLIYP